MNQKKAGLDEVNHECIPKPAISDFDTPIDGSLKEYLTTISSAQEQSSTLSGDPGLLFGTHL